MKQPVMSFSSPGSRRLTRRAAIGGATALAVAGTLPHRVLGFRRAQVATPVATPAAVSPGAIIEIAEAAREEMDLRAVLLQVMVDGDTVMTHAIGESMVGVPATVDMHFRNGAVAISYMSTLLLILVDQGVVGLDDTIDTWLPELPDADRVTLRTLASMTSGYQDYVQNPDLDRALYADPFRQWTPEELIEYGLATPRAFAPGENWAYSHTDYVILGLALEELTGTPLDALLQEHVLDPLLLTETGSPGTAWMPEPVLHAGSSERRAFLALDPAVRFYEDSTYWNPSWTIARGAIQYTTIDDMARSIDAMGRGTLLSAASHAEQVSKDLLGFGSEMEGCNNCHMLNEDYTYGLGIVNSRGWLMQNPLFHGFGGTAGYHPGTGVSIAVETTFGEGSFGDDGGLRYGNSSTAIFRQIGELFVPSGS